MSERCVIIPWNLSSFLRDRISTLGFFVFFSCADWDARARTLHQSQKCRITVEIRVMMTVIFSETLTRIIQDQRFCCDSSPDSFYKNKRRIVFSLGKILALLQNEILNRDE